jgi:putative membrane protein
MGGRILPAYAASVAREEAMISFLVRLAISALGLWLASVVVPGVRVDGIATLIVAAVLLGVANAIVRPILTIVTFPLTLVTLGLFLLVVNAAVIGLVAMFLPGFAIDGLLPGVGTAVVTGVVSWIGHAFLRGEDD